MTTATEVGPATSLSVGDRSFSAKDDFVPVTFAAEGKFTGPIVFVGYGMKKRRPAL